jgi:flagellar motor protein MotB
MNEVSDIDRETQDQLSKLQALQAAVEKLRDELANAPTSVPSEEPRATSAASGEPKAGKAQKGKKKKGKAEPEPSEAVASAAAAERPCPDVPADAPPAKGKRKGKAVTVAQAEPEPEPEPEPAAPKASKRRKGKRAAEAAAEPEAAEPAPPPRGHANRDVAVVSSGGGPKVRVRLSNEVVFAPGSIRITRSGRQALSEIADVLKNSPTKRIEIAGHSDVVPVVKGWEDNWQLSAERAHQVLTFLLAKGISPKLLVASGYGDTDPVSGDDSEESRAHNRRVEIFIEPEAGSQ